MHTSSTIVLVLAVFAACLVEMVEALTIVVAAGVSRGWRSALQGAAVAAVVLGVLVLAVGVPLIKYIPIDALRVLVGALLLVLGLNWLRKAILRASGHKALHDEDEIFRRETEAARAAGGEERAGLDWYSFTLSFKGVFLEGLEVAFIVITFGSSEGRVGLAAIAAGAALVVVGGVGVLVRAPLARVPENTLKFGVGLLLTTFGIFWATEGAGATWPGGDAALLAILGFLALVSLAAVRLLQRRRVLVRAVSA